METAQRHYAMGVSDAYANICMLARQKGCLPAIRDIAEIMLRFNPEHCHAKEVLKQTKYGYK